jgi:hypothetical protein
MFVAEVADKGGGDDAKTVGDGGVEVGECDQQEKDACVNQRDPAIDKVTFEVFPPAVAAGLEHNIFVAEEGAGDGNHIGRDDKDEIVDARIQKIVQGRVDEGSKERVPSAHGKIPQGLVSRLAEKN